MITIQSHRDGVTLAVRVQPGARKTAVIGEQAAALKVAVTAPPEDGRANEAVLALLHDWLGVKRSQLSLLTGATQRNKVILVAGLTVDELADRIRTNLAG